MSQVTETQVYTLFPGLDEYVWDNRRYLQCKVFASCHEYGVLGTPLRWFSSYLTGRHQFVKIGDVESSPKRITCRVPQGSNFGPLLFLLYINDLPKSSNKLSFRIFADNTNIFLNCRFRINCKRRTYECHKIL